MIAGNVVQHRSDLDRAVRSALAAARIDANITQVALSARLRRARGFIGKVEIGLRKTLSVGDFVLIARAVGVDPAELLAQIIAGGAQRTRQSVTARWIALSLRNDASLLLQQHPQLHALHAQLLRAATVIEELARTDRGRYSPQ